MDYLGAEISKKIKSAIRAKLVELGVYVDDELPDYIMVLVANKKTRTQMESDLALFLSDHTLDFVQWLQEVLDKLQTITLAKEKGEEGKDDKGDTKSGSTKEREKKRKSEGGSESAKKAKTDDGKEKEKDRKRSSAEVPKTKEKKDKVTKQAEKDGKKTQIRKDSDVVPSKKQEERTKSRDAEETRTIKSRGVEEPRSKAREVEKLRTKSRDVEESCTKARDVEESRTITKAREVEEPRTKGRDVEESLIIIKNRDLEESRTITKACVEESRTITKTHDVEEPRTKARDSGETRTKSRERRSAEAKTRDREKTTPTAKAPEPAVGSRRASGSLEREVGSEGRSQRRRSGEQSAERRHPRVSGPVELPPADEEDDQDVLTLSAEEDELVKEAPKETARPPVRAAAPAQAVRPTPAAPRLVNLRQESGMFGGRRVVTEEPASSAAARRRSRSPVRRRDVKVTDAESRWSRRGPQSTVGAVVSREEDEAGYDPLNPEVGAVASTVRVTERPRRPASQQPRPTLLLKAIHEARRSTVASVKPFLVRAPAEKPKQRRNKRESRELYTAGLSVRQRRQTSADDGASRAVQARSHRSGSPGQIAITVRNEPPSGRRRRRRSRPAAPSPPPPPPRPESESPPASEKEEEGEEEEKDTEEEKKKKASPSPSPTPPPDPPSSDDEDTVNVTIGKVKAHPQRKEPPPAEPPEYRPTPVLASVDDISAIVHAVADRIKNPPKQTERASSPTFVVTMTGLGASRFARSIDSDGPPAEDAPPAGEDVVVEEEEEEEEEVTEEDLRAQLLEDRARKRAHRPVIAPPPPDPEPPTPAPAPRPTATRCRFWPGCKQPDSCPFHHPTVPCKTFPACTFGDACLYIHPACKFGAACTRPDCRFSHGAARPAAAPPAATYGVGGVGRSAVRPGASALTECRFFPNCHNPACPYIHPKMCRYGEACTNASCLFAHPTPTTIGGRPQFKWVAKSAI